MFRVRGVGNDDRCWAFQVQFRSWHPVSLEQASWLDGRLFTWVRDYNALLAIFVQIIDMYYSLPVVAG